MMTDFLATAGRPVIHNKALGYGFALLAVLIALALRFHLDDSLPPGFPYLTFFPAVILTAFLAGIGPGLLGAVAAGLCAWYFFMHPYYSLALTGPSAIALGLYVFIITVDLALIHHMQLSVKSLTKERQINANLYEHQRTMFQELQHRVANNMAFVAGLLHMQKRDIAQDPAAAAAAIDEATRRIETMSRIHRRLYDPAAADIPVDQYFREICTDLLHAAGADHITLRIAMAPLRFDISQLMTLSLIVTEVVTNSLKHAFRDGNAGGAITITLSQAADGQVTLAVADDGAGLASPPSTAKARGLGTRIIEGLAAQLGATLQVVSSAGTTTRLTFPFAPAAACWNVN